MNFLENVHAIITSLFIAILLPITLYWGISSLYTYPTYTEFVAQHTAEQPSNGSEQNQESHLKQWQEAKKPFNKALFYSSIIIGILLIIMGAYSAKTLSTGFMCGGVFTVLMGLTVNPGIAFLNFIIVLMVLTTIIAVTIQKNHSS